MRILHIMRSLDPSGGGPPQGVRTLAEGYLRLGHQVEIATLDDPAAPFIPSLPFPVHAHGPVTSTYGYSPTLLPWLKENAGRFDGFIVNGLWQYHGRAAWQALHRRHRYAVFTHGMLDPYFNRAYPLKFLKKWPYWFLFERRLLKDAYRVLFTAEAEKTLAAQSFWPYHANPLVVPYGSPGPTGDAALQRAAFFEQCPTLAGHPFLLYLGRIHPKKGCDLLVEAFAKNAASDPTMHLVIAGPDHTGWQPELEATARRLGVADRIHWPGMISGDLKWGAFHAADAFILPSHQENFGIAVAEALACSLPVLISDKVNIYDEVRRDGAAIVAPDTLDGTTALIERWYKLSRDERDQMRLRAHQCYQSRYNSQRLPAAILALFQ